MTFAEIKRALADANLTQLARATDIPLRTLRRIKNGAQSSILTSTAETLSQHLQPTRSKK